jgi:hypothetical protein
MPAVASSLSPSRLPSPRVLYPGEVPSSKSPSAPGSTDRLTSSGHLKTPTHKSVGSSGHGSSDKSGAGESGGSVAGSASKKGSSPGQNHGYVHHSRIHHSPIHHSRIHHSPIQVRQDRSALRRAPPRLPVQEVGPAALGGTDSVRCAEDVAGDEQARGGGTVRILYSYSTHTVLALYSPYCTHNCTHHTVLSILYSHCTHHTVLSILYSHCTHHTVLTGSPRRRSRR